VKNVDFDKMTRDFLRGVMGESKSTDVWSYIQSVMESLHSIKPRTKAGSRKVAIALEHMKEIRRHTRRLEERVKVLEEQVQVLEEGG